MANVKLVFQGSEKSETENHELVAYANVDNEIYIRISVGDEFIPRFICLDKSTAVKLVKELKLQISYLESEVPNA